MKIWDDLRRHFFKKTFLRKIGGAKTERLVTNLSDAGYIGILYDSTNPDNDIIITKFAEELRKQGKKVEILAYINDSKIDHKADVTIFNKNQINWCWVPQDTRVDSFISKPFDVLLAAYITKNFPLEYITRLSKSKWRVGAYDESCLDAFDMMINMNAQKGVDYFLQQASHFLNQIRYDSKQA